MTLQERIAAIEEAGYFVQIRHFRHMNNGGVPSVNSYGGGAVQRLKVDLNMEVFPRGGNTTVEIVREDGTLVTFGVAKCSLRDNYDKKRGVQIALGRALKPVKELR